jgi:hypothetical protein
MDEFPENQSPNVQGGQFSAGPSFEQSNCQNPEIMDDFVFRDVGDKDGSYTAKLMI